MKKKIIFSMSCIALLSILLSMVLSGVVSYYDSLEIVKKATIAESRYIQNGIALGGDDYLSDIRSAGYDTAAAQSVRVTVVDTGLSTMTGGRLRRVQEYLEPGQPFCFTYGDGVADLDMTAQFAFHRAHGCQATVTAVQPPGRYGALVRNGDTVAGFEEKPRGDGGWINGGFFVLQPEVIDLIDGDATPWEAEPMQRLAQSGQLQAFEHAGFWQPMDTLREKNFLEELWQSGQAPWKCW